MILSLQNAPATIQHFVNKVLDGVKCCEAYLDGVVIYSYSWPEPPSEFGWLQSHTCSWLWCHQTSVIHF